jgi:hypothetical protein
MSLRDINWRRGLLRLWLLFTVPWVIILGLLTVNESKTYFERVNIEKKIRALKQGIENDKTPLKLPNGIRMRLVDVMSDKIFLELPYNDQKKILIDLSNKFAKLDDNEQDKFFYALKTNDFSVYKGDFIFFIYLTLLPPLLLLGIGTTTYWAFRGFSPKQ